MKMSPSLRLSAGRSHLIERLVLLTPPGRKRSPVARNAHAPDSHFINPLQGPSQPVVLQAHPLGPQVVYFSSGEWITFRAARPGAQIFPRSRSWPGCSFGRPCRRQPRRRLRLGKLNKLTAAQVERQLRVAPVPPRSWRPRCRTLFYVALPPAGTDTSGRRRERSTAAPRFYWGLR